MRDADVFEGAFKRLAATGLTPAHMPAVRPARSADPDRVGPGKPAGPGRRGPPFSRLLPRLALAAPRRRARPPEAAE